MTTRVLVVDSEVASCQMVRTVLNSMGVATETISDSSVAETVLRAEKFDAVFLDAKMPTPSGLDLVRHMRARGFNQNTPVIMMTGESEPALLAQAFEAGTNFFLFKPVDRRKLQRILRATQFTVEREKRRYQRVRAELPLQVECNHRCLKGFTEDISMGGMLIHAEDAFPLGSRVRLDVKISEDTPTFRASGRVMRLMEVSAMGIEFEPLEQVEADRLQEFLLPFILAQTELETVVA